MNEKSMLVEDVPLESIVCFEYLNTVHDSKKWVLISRWTEKIKEDYLFAHSQPYTSEKGNREPDFPDAIYEYVDSDKMDPKSLMEIYRKKEKGPYKTKIHDHRFFCVLG